MASQTENRANVNSTVRIDAHETQQISLGIGPSNSAGLRSSKLPQSALSAFSKRRRSGSAALPRPRLSTKVALAIAIPPIGSAFTLWAGIFAQRHLATDGGHEYLYKLAPIHFLDWAAVVILFLGLAIFNRKDFLFLRDFSRALRHFRIEAIEPSPQELYIWGLWKVAKLESEIESLKKSRTV